jgi:DNA-binding NarL/FixJ family response regulator
MTRVLVCGGESGLMEGLTTASLEAGEFSIVACSGREHLLSNMNARWPDVVLLDASVELATDFLSGLEFLAPLPRIVLRMPSAPPEFAFSTVTMGVRGVIFKSASIETLLNCLTSVSEGELWFDKSVFDCVTLPPPEFAVLRISTRSGIGK